MCNLPKERQMHPPQMQGFGTCRACGPLGTTRRSFAAALQGLAGGRGQSDRPANTEAFF